MFYKLIVVLLLFECIIGQITNVPTLSPTANISIPDIATLRPTMPTMPPLMQPEPDRDMPENKTDEMPIVAVYFIMLGISFSLTFVGVTYHIYGALVPTHDRNKIVDDNEW